MGVAKIIAVIFFISTLWNGIGLICCMFMFEMGDSLFDFFNPCWIYNHVRVNIIGCILLTIFVHILCPIFAIGYWIYKICTIGRKY